MRVSRRSERIDFLKKAPVPKRTRNVQRGKERQAFSEFIAAQGIQSIHIHNEQDCLDRSANLRLPLPGRLYHLFKTSGSVIGPSAVAATPEVRMPTYGMSE